MRRFARMFILRGILVLAYLAPPIGGPGAQDIRASEVLVGLSAFQDVDQSGRFLKPPSHNAGAGQARFVNALL
jgi:hypothetical protein